MASTTRLTEAQMRALNEDLFEAWNRHDIEGVLKHMQPDVLWVDPTLDEPAHGKVGAAASMANTFTAFPDFHLPADDFEAFYDVDAQSAVAVWTARGTMTGRLDTGVPATGRPVDVRGSTLVRLRDGLVSEYRFMFDALDMMQQMGLLPKSTGVGFKALVMADVMAGKAMKVLQRH
jgi:steroid delta-isomerase-like uncharacterized protein